MFCNNWVLLKISNLCLITGTDPEPKAHTNNIILHKAKSFWKLKTSNCQFLTWHRPIWAKSWILRRKSKIRRPIFCGWYLVEITMGTLRLTTYEWLCWQLKGCMCNQMLKCLRLVTTISSGCTAWLPARATIWASLVKVEICISLITMCLVW